MGVEWDGMIRLLFNRKNKTLRSVLNTKATLKLLEENRKTLRRLKKHQKKANDSTAMSDEEDDDNESVKDILERIVAKPDYKDKRARQLDLDDFLQLLSDFHDEGVYFTS